MVSVGWKYIVPLYMVLVYNLTFSQYNEHNWGLSLSYNYTSTSKMFLFPKAVDPILRSQNIELNDILSYSAELRFYLTDEFAIAIGSEYMKETKKRDFVFGGPTGSFRVEVEEGFLLVPIELSAYFILPFSTQSFKFYMGGGLGIYLGNHIRKYKGIELESADRMPALGIHVNTGMDYIINDFFSVRGEMRFRDPQFEMKSKFNKDEVEYGGEVYELTDSTFESKVNIDGITFTVGIVIHFL
ncbi:hypothetical protein ACFLS9_00395 [Bacteroidota bacterium]